MVRRGRRRHGRDRALDRRLRSVTKLMPDTDGIMSIGVMTDLVLRLESSSWATKRVDIHEELLAGGVILTLLHRSYASLSYWENDRLTILTSRPSLPHYISLTKRHSSYLILSSKSDSWSTRRPVFCTFSHNYHSSPPPSQQTQNSTMDLEISC